VNLKPRGSASVSFMAAAVLAKAKPGVESNRATFQVRITNLIRGLWRSPGCVCVATSPALKLRTQALQPVAARPAFIATAGALRHDALEAQLAGVGEHDRAVVSD
jgi:hypothetical protein